MNEKYDELIHNILTRPDGVTEYVRIQDVDGNWIEVDITPDNEEEFKNPNNIFRPIPFRKPGRRQRQHIPVLNKTDSIEVVDWGAKKVEVRCRMNYGLGEKPWKGGVNVYTPSEDAVMRMIRAENPNAPTQQLLAKTANFRRRWVMDELEHFRIKRQRVRPRKPDIPQESDMD